MVPQRSRRGPADDSPLGSISSGDPAAVRGTEACLECGSTSLTRVAMTLGDGSAVTYVSCQACEHRNWFAAGGDGRPLDRDDVLSRHAP